MKIKYTNCYNCGSSESELYDSENGFNLKKCSNCGLLYVNPRPADEIITNSTKTGIHHGESEINVKSFYNEIKVIRYLDYLNELYKVKELVNKNWLDIGCGYGEFLIALNKYSENRILCEGSEPMFSKREHARKMNLNVNSIDLDNCDTKYDFISLLDVYSHLPEPIETLSKWKNLIKEGGEILIETGHSSHLSPKYHNKPYVLPDHLSFINKELMKEILAKVGFEIIDIKIYRAIFYRDYTFINFSKEMVKYFLRRPNTFHSFFPKFQHGDMWVRARKT